MYGEWSVSENPESENIADLSLKLVSFKPPSPCLLFFKMNARQEYTSLKAFLLQPIG